MGPVNGFAWWIGFFEVLFIIEQSGIVKTFAEKKMRELATRRSV